jgi:hypothetical protein
MAFLLRVAFSELGAPISQYGCFQGLRERFE